MFDRRSEMSSQLAATVTEESVSHLFRLLQPDGKFVYAHPLMTPDEILPGYNLLRHCGTVWFMCKAIELLALEFGTERRKALGAAVRYIVRKLRTPAWDGADAASLCLVSKDAVKLGGVGLACLMIRGFGTLMAARGQEVDRDPLPLGVEGTCRRLEAYLLSQCEAGDFHHKRVFSTGAVLPFRSEYYTGEALFALMMADEVPETVIRTMEGLMLSQYGIPQQSHWMAYAACASYHRGVCDPNLVRSYLERLVECIITDAGYRGRRQCTPIACRSEALAIFLEATAASNSPDAGAARPDLRLAARSAVEENLKLQLGFYQHGQFHKGDDDLKVQIDYIQHNGAAFLGWVLLSRLAEGQRSTPQRRMLP